MAADGARGPGVGWNGEVDDPAGGVERRPEEVVEEGGRRREVERRVDGRRMLAIDGQLDLAEKRRSRVVVGGELGAVAEGALAGKARHRAAIAYPPLDADPLNPRANLGDVGARQVDRKSTRLNSSHG